MAIFVMKNASVTINSVDLSSYCSEARVSYEVDAIPADVFGTNYHKFEAGLENSTVTVSLNQDFAATKTEATIFPLVGTTTTVVVKADSGAVSATNPSYTCTGFLASSQPVNGAVNELAQMQLVFTGRVVKATA